jgi:hypothetical protein
VTPITYPLEAIGYPCIERRGWPLLIKQGNVMKHDHTLNNEKHELTVNQLDAVAGGYFRDPRGEVREVRRNEWGREVVELVRRRW